jgi:hypothetical protein
MTAAPLPKFTKPTTELQTMKTNVQPPTKARRALALTVAEAAFDAPGGRTIEGLASATEVRLLIAVRSDACPARKEQQL